MRRDLLYVSSYANDGEDVNVYSYPGGKLEGTLTGFELPSGECIDKAGNIFITNYNGADILEYAHGGTAPIATLHDPYSYPLDCSVDPTTGNLAVANYVGSDGYGNVAIYEHRRGEPRIYADANVITLPGSCSYDVAGNLFVDGYNANLNYTLAELRNGDDSLATVKVPRGGEKWLGHLRWDGEYVVANNSNNNMVYRLRISNFRARLVGSTQLSDGWHVDQISIPKFGSGKVNPQGRRLVGPDYYGGNVKIWNYPAGGESIRTIGGAGEPVGTAVSPASR